MKYPCMCLKFIKLKIPTIVTRKKGKHYIKRIKLKEKIVIKISQQNVEEL